MPLSSRSWRRRPRTAWPAVIVESLARDARRLVPRSLAQLMADREKEIFEASRAMSPELGLALATDFNAGALRPATVCLLEANATEALDLFRQRRVTEGVIKLGALLRVPADLSDPVLTGGPEGYPAGVTREYYAFVEGSLDKIPVVLDDPPALKLQRRDLPRYWNGAPRPQPRAVGRHPHRALPARPRDRPSHDRLPVAGLRRRLPRPTRGR